MLDSALKKTKRSVVTSRDESSWGGKNDSIIISRLVQATSTGMIVGGSGRIERATRRKTESSSSSSDREVEVEGRAAVKRIGAKKPNNRIQISQDGQSENGADRDIGSQTKR
jgi:hypothetical protein